MIWQHEEKERRTKKNLKTIFLTSCNNYFERRTRKNILVRIKEPTFKTDLRVISFSAAAFTNG